MHAGCIIRTKLELPLEDPEKREVDRNADGDTSLIAGAVFRRLRRRLKLASGSHAGGRRLAMTAALRLYARLFSVGLSGTGVLSPGVAGADFWRRGDAGAAIELPPREGETDARRWLCDEFLLREAREGKYNGLSRRSMPCDKEDCDTVGDINGAGLLLSAPPPVLTERILF